LQDWPPDGEAMHAFDDWHTCQLAWLLGSDATHIGVLLDLMRMHAGRVPIGTTARPRSTVA
jgi:hypothetical protein